MKKGNNPVRQFWDEIVTLHNPRFMIIVAHGLLEVLVDALIDVKCKNKQLLDNNRDYPHSVKVVILHELGFIDDTWFRHLNAFRKLRNKAAHGGEFELTKEMLVPFKDAPNQQPPIEIDDPHFVKSLCTQLVFHFWSYQAEIFSDYFFPIKSKYNGPKAG